MATAQKILCVLYDDPVDGYPSSYARAGIPSLTSYPGGQSMPSPGKIDFVLILKCHFLGKTFLSF